MFHLSHHSSLDHGLERTGQINLANVGAASGAVSGAALGAARFGAGRTAGQFVSGMFRGGKSRQQARIARIRGTESERKIADAGGRMGARLKNAVTRSKSNIASVDARSK